MSKDHDSPAYWQRIRDEGGPVPQGRAVPLREGDRFAGNRVVTDATASSYAVRLVASMDPGPQAPQAAGAPSEARETGAFQRGTHADHDNAGGSAADPIVARVCALLLSRSAVGVKKYGTTLGRTDLTRKQWLTHARDEAMDMALYLQRLIEMEDGE